MHSSGMDVCCSWNNYLCSHGKPFFLEVRLSFQSSHEEEAFAAHSQSWDGEDQVTVPSVDTDPWTCHLRAVWKLLYMNVNQELPPMKHRKQVLYKQPVFFSYIDFLSVKWGVFMILFFNGFLIACAEGKCYGDNLQNKAYSHFHFFCYHANGLISLLCVMRSFPWLFYPWLITAFLAYKPLPSYV